MHVTVDNNINGYFHDYSRFNELTFVPSVIIHRTRKSSGYKLLGSIKVGSWMTRESKRKDISKKIDLHSQMLNDYPIHSTVHQVTIEHFVQSSKSRTPYYYLGSATKYKTKRKFAKIKSRTICESYPDKAECDSYVCTVAARNNVQRRHRGPMPQYGGPMLKYTEGHSHCRRQWHVSIQRSVGKDKVGQCQFGQIAN